MTQLDVRVLIGSLRSASYNRKLFDASHELVPEGISLTEIPIWELPHYNQEIQQDPTPVVERFWEAIRESDAMLFITPEYNYSIPGVLKNAIDWASRPAGSSPIYGKPGAFFGASGGRSGTMRMQLHMRQVLPCLNMPLLLKPEVFIPNVADAFDDEGNLVDDRLKGQLIEFYEAFEQLIRLQRS
ncbi:MAG: NAD(P)H-dependent oxidoreductase [Thermomicrobiales bacterium]|nr:NAD(P)H-dependent oxidoreductase [Thermomicrobiales bacterium]